MQKVLGLDILVVEDDQLHLEIIKNKLNNLGYHQVKSVSTYKAACDYLEHFIPDLIILDYYLDKNFIGTDLIKEYLLNKYVPIIFLSSFYGDDVLKNIVEFAPVDFMPKNLSEFDLDKAINLAIIKRKEHINNSKLKDYMFVKSGKEIRKIPVSDIEYVSVDGKYLVLNYNAKKFLVRSTLNDFLNKLPNNFVKIHQAYIINLKYLESIQVDDSTVRLGNTSIPFSRNYKKDLFASYYMP